jgi:carbonic anhydrase
MEVLQSEEFTCPCLIFPKTLHNFIVICTLLLTCCYYYYYYYYQSSIQGWDSLLCGTFQYYYYYYYQSSIQGWDSLLCGTFQNTGHSLQFTPLSSKPLLATPHGIFSFKQFHFHWGTKSNQGSEHCVNGDSYEAEIHFVHMKTSDSQDESNSLAVIGAFCQADTECIDLECWEKILVPQEAGQVMEVKDIKICSYIPSDLDYYYYKGSLTTPPCSENVLWYVIKQPLKVPEEFLVKMRQMKDAAGRRLTFNHRQCMPLHDRLVQTPK